MPNNILVVDDQTEMTMLLKLGLKKYFTCPINAAHGGQQAMDLFEQTPFDVLLTDYSMPEIDGITLAEFIHQNYPQTVIIMISAFNTERIREEVSEEIVPHILKKPIKFSLLQEMIKEIMANKAQSDGVKG